MTVLKVAEARFVDEDAVLLIGAPEESQVLSAGRRSRQLASYVSRRVIILLSLAVRAKSPANPPPCVATSEETEEARRATLINSSLA